MDARLRQVAALARLEKVTAAEAAAKHAALRQVRDAFVWRDPSDGPPSAADHILKAACALSRRWRQLGGIAMVEAAANETARKRRRRVAVDARFVEAGAAGIRTVGGKCVLA